MFLASRTGPSHVELKINERLVELYHHEEILWRQRSRINWLAKGEKNTILLSSGKHEEEEKYDQSIIEFVGGYG